MEILDILRDLDDHFHTLHKECDNGKEVALHVVKTLKHHLTNMENDWDNYFDLLMEDYARYERDMDEDERDGDAASALASAGFGTDEDYGYFGGDE